MLDSVAGGESIKEFGLRDFEEAHIRVERGTEYKKNRNAKNKRKLGNRRINDQNLKRVNQKKKFKKDKKVKDKTGNGKSRNRSGSNSRQNSCQTTSEVDAVCIQVRSYLQNLSSLLSSFFMHTNTEHSVVEAKSLMSCQRIQLISLWK